MRVIVPFAVHDPKTRLSSLFEPDERAAFARAMLHDVLHSIDATGHQPIVLATAPTDFDAQVRVDDRPLSDAVNAILEETSNPVAVVMADLALANEPTLRQFFSTAGDVVIAPGRGGGTNALIVGHENFRVDYHGVSYRDHLCIARDIGATVTEFDSHRLSTDIDEPEDLPEILLHGEGTTRTWLHEAGFRLTVEDGRATAVRAE